MTQKLAFKVEVGAEVLRARKAGQKVVINSHWVAERWKGGSLIESREVDNTAPDAFIDYVLDAALSGGTPITTWYLLLFSDNYSATGAETYASPGFTEATGYDETVRQTWSEAGVSSKTITNSASKATFTMDGTSTTIYGCALVSVSTKGDTAGGGTLGPIALFTSALTGIADDEVLKVYMTITGSDV